MLCYGYFSAKDWNPQMWYQFVCVCVCVCVCVSEAALAEMGVALKDDSSLVGVFSPKQVSSRLYNVSLLYDINSRYDTIRDAISTCARKPT